ncbi:Quinol monooxygenase YgiN [Rhizobium sp. EC-SD404]|nr:Quinol monooxygenase YgiN [Rhizobium sp. EC-SD404]
MEAKPGKKAEVEAFLRNGLPIFQNEPGTVAWFSVRIGPSTFGIFDAFFRRSRTASVPLRSPGGGPDGEGARAFASSLIIEELEMLAAKLP